MNPNGALPHWKGGRSWLPSAQRRLRISLPTGWWSWLAEMKTKPSSYVWPTLRKPPTSYLRGTSLKANWWMSPSERVSSFGWSRQSMTCLLDHGSIAERMAWSPAKGQDKGGARWKRSASILRLLLLAKWPGSCAVRALRMDTGWRSTPDLLIWKLVLPR